MELSTVEIAAAHLDPPRITITIRTVVTQDKICNRSSTLEQRVVTVVMVDAEAAGRHRVKETILVVLAFH